MFNIETICLEKNSKYTPCDFASKMVKFQGKMKLIGQGYYSSVYASKRQNYVYKVSEEDGAYLKFVKVLSKQTKQNPHFPVIHAARLIKSRDYKVLVVCMERLKSLERLSFPGYPFEDIIKSSPKMLLDFCKIIKMDAGMSEALHLMSVLCNKHNLKLDLHPGNVMLRGEQIVFTDPFL